MLDCKTVDEQLLDYLYDELPPGERDTLRAHIDGCDRCRAELDAFGQVRTVARQAMPMVDPPAAASSKLLYRASQERPRGAKVIALFTRVARHPVYAIAASFVVVGGIAGVGLLRGQLKVSAPEIAAAPPAAPSPLDVRSAERSSEASAREAAAEEMTAKAAADRVAAREAAAQGAQTKGAGATAPPAEAPKRVDPSSAAAARVQQKLDEPQAAPGTAVARHDARRLTQLDVSSDSSPSTPPQQSAWKARAVPAPGGGGFGAAAGRVPYAKSARDVAAEATPSDPLSDGELRGAPPLNAPMAPPLDDRNASVAHAAAAPKPSASAVPKGTAGPERVAANDVASGGEDRSGSGAGSLGSFGGAPAPAAASAPPPSANARARNDDVETAVREQAQSWTDARRCQSLESDLARRGYLQLSVEDRFERARCQRVLGHFHAAEQQLTALLAAAPELRARIEPELAAVRAAGGAQNQAEAAATNAPPNQAQPQYRAAPARPSSNSFDAEMGAAPSTGSTSTRKKAASKAAPARNTSSSAAQPAEQHQSAH